MFQQNEKQFLKIGTVFIMNTLTIQKDDVSVTIALSEIETKIIMIVAFALLFRAISKN